MSVIGESLVAAHAVGSDEDAVVAVAPRRRGGGRPARQWVDEWTCVLAVATGGPRVRAVTLASTMCHGPGTSPTAAEAWGPAAKAPGTPCLQ